MNLGDLKQKVAASTDMSLAGADAAVKAVVEAITESLRNGETVSMTGFGSFSVAARAARTGRNPRTGEKIKISASKVVKFRVGKTLKDAVNEKKKAVKKKKKKKK